MNYKNIFSLRLRELRKNNNLTLSQLSEIINLSKGTLSDIENSKNFISFDKAIELADYFQVSVDYLVGRTDNPNSHKS